MCSLVKEGRCDLQSVHRSKQKGDSGDIVLSRIRILVQQGTCRVSDMIDVAAIGPGPQAGTESRFALHQRTTAGHTHLPVRRSVVLETHFAARVEAVARQAGRRCNESYRAALRPRTEQRALRSAQNFHSLQIKQLRIGGEAAVKADVTRLDGRIVNVHTGSSRTDCGADTTNGNIHFTGSSRLRIHARYQPGQIGDVLCSLLVEGLLRDGADADWYGRDVLCSLLRCDDHLFQCVGWRSLSMFFRRADARPNDYQHERCSQDRLRDRHAKHRHPRWSRSDLGQIPWSYAYVVGGRRSWYVRLAHTASALLTGGSLLQAERCVNRPVEIYAAGSCYRSSGELPPSFGRIRPTSSMLERGLFVNRGVDEPPIQRKTDRAGAASRNGRVRSQVS